MRAITTQRIYAYKPYGELWECLDSALQEFLLECEILSYAISFTQIAHIPLLFEGVDMLVLSGGNDIGAYPKRDHFELALLDYALKAHKKVFAICRGAQLVAHYFNIPLKASKHKIKAIHTLQGRLTHDVHSYHHFCITQAPKDCEVLAYVDDEIEAFMSSQILGVMWHPEREERRESDRALLKQFITQSVHKHNIQDSKLKEA